MSYIRPLKSILLIISLFLITSCSNKSAMKPEDFKNKEPRLIIEEYLSGNVKAWGVLQNRSGKVTRQFSADLDGSWDGEQLILKEKFNWDDGEIQNREWKIIKIDENNYEGTAGDVVGKAKGYSYGPAFKFEYVLLTLLVVKWHSLLHKLSFPNLDFYLFCIQATFMTICPTSQLFSQATLN